VYDRYGFRNPDSLSNWEVVIVGDSFVELGFLEYEDLFTTQIGKLLGIRVKNLGVSYVGPLTYVFYLERYGKAANTKHALMVFFEGNDLGDLEREARALERFTASGEREYIIIRKEPSFLKMLLSRLLPRDGNTQLPFPFSPSGDKTDSGENAYFTSKTGEVPVAVHYTPPGKEQITVRTQALLTSALAKWAKIAKTHGMKPWVVYLPCSLRVLHGHLRFLENATKSVREWNPTDLPDFVREISLLNGIAFIDVTPALARETEDSRLTFNPVGDNHLNRDGALLVAEVIAQALKASPAD